MKYDMKPVFKSIAWVLAFFVFGHIVKTQVFLVGLSLLFLWAFFLSQEDEVVYLAVLFVLISGPGGFFEGHISRILALGPYNLSLAEMFSLTALFKIMKQRRQTHNMFRAEYLIYLLFVIGLLTIGMIEGMRLDTTYSKGLTPYTGTFRMLLLYPLYATTMAICHSKEKVRVLYEIIIVFVILNLLFQVFHYTTGTSVVSIIGGLSYGEGQTDKLIRPVYGYYMVFLSFMLSIFYLAQHKTNALKNYAILAVSFLSIFVGATRGWMLAFLFMMAVSWIVITKLKLQELLKNGIIALVIVFLLLQVGGVSAQLQKSIDRLSTLELILEGDPTAGGTNRRLTDRHFPVMQKFYEKPLLGWGFSSTTFEYYDTHVGNQSILLAGGVLGLTLFIALFFSMIVKIIRTSKYDQANLVFAIALMGMLIIHSSSTDLFGFMAPTLGGHYVKVVFLSIIFAAMNAIMQGSGEQKGAIL